MLEKKVSNIVISVLSMSCIFNALHCFVNSICLLVSRGGGGSNSPVIMFTEDQKDIQLVKNNLSRKYTDILIREVQSINTMIILG